MKVKKVIGKSLLVLLCIVVAIVIIGVAQFHHRSDPKNLKQYETNNPFITGETAISAQFAAAPGVSILRRRWQRSAAAQKIRMSKSTISSSTCT